METGLVRLGCGVTDPVAYKQLISYSSGGWRSQIKVSVGLVSSEASLLGMKMAALLLCFHLAFSLAPGVFSYKDTSPIGLGPHPYYLI